MSNPRKEDSDPSPDRNLTQGSTPSAPQPSPDAELELDDLIERSAPRPRPPKLPKLPDHRREQPLFEFAGQKEPRSADVREQNLAPYFEGRMEQVWRPASETEISGFDPSRDSAPAPTAKKQSPYDAEFEELAQQLTTAARVEKKADLSDLDEFLARTEEPTPPAESKKERRPYTMVERICLGIGAAAVLGLGIWLFSAATKGMGADVRRSTTVPDVPLEGELITVEEVSSGWRARTKSDRVARIEVFLPKPDEVMPAFIPQVNFTISGNSKAGYLRFMFKDSEGNARGDTRVVRVDNGKLVSLDNGEIISSPTSGSVYSSNGLQDTHNYHSYTSSTDPRWSVEVSESPSYDARDKDWKPLAHFDIRNAMLK